jgi:hypothetical protein
MKQELTCEIQSRIVIAKAAFNKATFFSSKLDLKKKLVKCYIWNNGLCGAETWILQTVDQLPGMFENVAGVGDGWRVQLD